MKKVYRLQDLDCAINKIGGVERASVNFLTQRLAVEADEERFEEIMDEIARVCRKVEPDCKILR